MNRAQGRILLSALLIAATFGATAARAADPLDMPVVRHPEKTAIVREVVDGLSGEATLEQRKALREKLNTVFRNRCAVGWVPGVDLLMLPTLCDEWRLAQLDYEDNWKYNRWSQFERILQMDLSVRKDLPAENDLQAYEFVKAGREIKDVDSVRIWTLCRNFEEVYPRSAKVGEIKEVRKDIERELAKKNIEMRTYNHIPVREPLVRRPPAGRNMVPFGYSAIYEKFTLDPTRWDAYHEAVDFMAEREQKRIAAGEPKPRRWGSVVFLAPIGRHKGNPWPQMAEAVCDLHVFKNSERALYHAENAVILTPDLAKAQAVYGMVLLQIGERETDAFVALKKALAIDPASLGGEIWTAQAAAFLVDRLSASDKADLKGTVEMLSALKPYGSEKPLSEDEAFTAAVKRASAN